MRVAFVLRSAEVQPLFRDLCDSITKTCPDFIVMIMNWIGNCHFFTPSFVLWATCHASCIKMSMWWQYAQIIECLTFLQLHLSLKPLYTYMYDYAHTETLPWCLVCCQSKVCFGRYSPCPTVNPGHHNHKTKTTMFHTKYLYRHTSRARATALQRFNSYVTANSYLDRGK